MATREGIESKGYYYSENLIPESQYGRDKIREHIAKEIMGLKRTPNSWSYEFTDELLEYLHSKGVVIKVDRELPINPCEKCELNLSRECNNVCMERTQYEIRVDMLKAGYVAVEPLISPQSEI